MKKNERKKKKERKKMCKREWNLSNVWHGRLSPAINIARLPVARSMKHDQKKSVPQTREISKFTALREEEQKGEAALCRFVPRTRGAKFVCGLCIPSPLLHTELTNSKIFLFERLLSPPVVSPLSRVTEISRTLLRKDSQSLP